MRVEVTQEDINKGYRNFPSKCALALAIGRSLDAAGRVSDKVSIVTCCRVTSKEGFNCFVDLSQRARKFVRDFDAGKEVKPSVFILDI